MAAVWRSHCALVRILSAKSKKVLNNSTYYGISLTPGPLSVVSQNYSNYAKSPFVDKIKEEYEFESVKDPEVWKYVKRLMPYEEIPKVIPKEHYPSGWIPPKEEAKTLEFFIPRMKDHSLPIILNLKFRGQKKTTVIKRIEGDIWLLNDLIKSYLKTKNQKYIETRVNELAQFIEIKGDYVSDVLEWAYARGF